MYTKRCAFSCLLIGAALILASCAALGGRGLGGGIPGSGNVQTETRTPGVFEAITLAYPADVIIRQGADPSVQIEADDNLLAQLSTEVVSGRLTIANRETEWKKQVNPSTPVKITVTVKDVREIEFSAPVGTLEANGLQAGTLKLILSGGAQMKISALEVDMLDGTLSGAGDVQIAGTADEIKLLHSGLGNFNAGGLQSRKATVELSGMGNATVRVESELVATITGAGSINYYGQPRIEKKLNGAGAVKPAEEAD